MDVSDKQTPKIINSYDIAGKPIIAISQDLANVYVGGFTGVARLDLKVATLYKRKNFAPFEIKLMISNNLSKPISMSVTDDGKGKINVGSYDSNLTPSEYRDKVVTIPITAVASQSGTSVVTITLNDGISSTKQKLYVQIVD